jgi:hypothetical protein
VRRLRQHHCLRYLRTRHRYFHLELLRRHSLNRCCQMFHLELLRRPLNCRLRRQGRMLLFRLMQC